MKLHTFYLQVENANGQDIYPPGKITNLKAYPIGREKIAVEFTATGDDLDIGKGLDNNF